MIDSIRVLLVEDDEPTVDAWKTSIDMYNAKNEDSLGYRFVPFFARSLEAAMQSLGDYKIDAAVIDTRLGGSPENTDGDKVRKEVLSSEIAIVAQFSGEPGRSDISGNEKKIVRCFTKAGSREDGGASNEDILAWLAEHSEFISLTRGARDRIKREMANLFKNSIWPRWQFWVESKDEREDFSVSAMSRHIVSHVYSTLLDGSAQKAHPEEWYFLPALSDSLRTGDICQVGTALAVVVTPRCDIERLNESGTIQLAECESIKNEWLDKQKERSELLTQLASPKNDQQKIKLEKKLRGFDKEFRKEFSGHKNGSTCRHFLPELKLAKAEGVESYGPFYVRFDKIVTVPVVNRQKMRELLDGRIGSVTPDFLPSLVERLGAYFSRIGSPDYSNVE